MPGYVEYRIDENTTILIEGPQDSGGLVRASRTGEAIEKAEKTLEDAWKGIRAQAEFLIKEIDALQVSEAEVKFGVSTTGQLDLVVSKLGLGVNYEITLKWKKEEPKA